MKNSNVEIKPGQVWADRQNGQEGRTVEITSIETRQVDPGNHRIRYITRTATSLMGQMTERNLRRSFELVDAGASEPLESEHEASGAVDTMRAQKASHEALGGLRAGLEREGGGCTMTFDGQEWLCAIEFGREAPDSPMVGGAAYATGDTLADALIGALEQTNWT